MVSVAARALPVSLPESRPDVAVVIEDDEISARVAGALSESELILCRVVWPPLDPSIRRLDLVVMYSQEMSGQDLSLIRDLRREQESMHIVVVCPALNSRVVRRALDTGTSGLVRLEQVEEALAPTVAAVLAGQTAVPRAYGNGLRPRSLSYREKQVLGLVVMGFTNGQIGSRLFLSESTVKSHLSSSFTKLGVASRSEAAALILDPEESVGGSILRIVAQMRDGETAVVA